MTCTGLQGLVKVLDELIPEVLLSTLKPYIKKPTCTNELIISRGLVPIDKVETHVNTEGKLMARLKEFHRQHLPHA
jgi:hypothetical protein